LLISTDLTFFAIQVPYRIALLRFVSASAAFKRGSIVCKAAEEIPRRRPINLLMEKFSPTRASLGLGLIACLMLTLLGRVYWLQTYGRAPVLEKAERQQHSIERLAARRGSIFDSTGQLLAGSIQTQTLFVDTKEVIETAQTVSGGESQLEKNLASLGKLIDRDGFELLQLIGEKYPARYIEIAHDLDTSTIAAVQKLDIAGVGTMPANKRIYPMGSLAAHVLGTVGSDGVGLDGVELQFNEHLSGKDGEKRSLKDARRRSISTDEADYRPATHGEHLVLTIDANIQAIVEQELTATCRQYDAAAGEAVVIDPMTGAVIALANYPTFSPGAIEDSRPAQRTNRALVSPYEPGSTIKPFIVSRALDRKQVTLADNFDIHGPRWKTPYNRTITDVHGYDRLALWDVLVKSSNIGMCQLGERLGNPELHSTLTAFGFGSRSEIDIPGEDDGVVRPLKKWSKHSTDSIAQGYEMLVTPMQMARAMSAIANGGKLVTPYVVAGTIDAENDLHPIRENVSKRVFTKVIEPETAASIRRVLADIPVRGTATKARNDKYNIFGKTGTAHRAVNGVYDQDHYTSSFVGGAPFENPRLVIAFVIHDPDRSKAHYGGIVAAPGASRLLERALTYLQVPPSPTLTPPPAYLVDRLFNFDPKIYERKTKLAKAD
jgi:cell division protein FtsI (penicillin-binding protein 3)